MKNLFRLMTITCVLINAVNFGFAQTILPNAGFFDQNPYPTFDPNGSIIGTYTVTVSKTSESFTHGDFVIQVAIPGNDALFTGTDYVLPNEFEVVPGTGQDGDDFLSLRVKAGQFWSGTGPGNTQKIFLLKTKIIGASDEQPTLVSISFPGPASNNMVITAGPPVGANLNVANIPLPVIFSEVNARETNCKAEITWTTTSEQNNSHFIIERSATGDKYSKIGTVAATNNALGYSYRFVDESPLKGTSTYRIVQVDNDGKFTTSKVLVLSTNCAVTSIELYPNPTAALVNVKGLQGKNTVRILNIAGQEILMEETESSLHSMKVDNLAPGTYHIQVVKDSEIVFNGKFVKVD